MKRILIASGKVNVEYTYYPNSQTTDENETEIEIGNQNFGIVAEQLFDKLEELDDYYVEIFIKAKE